MSEMIWVVFGTTGEYSDRSEWAVDAWTTEEAAKARVEALKARYMELGVERIRREYDGPKRKEVFAEMEKMDPGFGCDYTGTDWYVIGVALKR